MDPLMPPPVRRIALDREPTVAPATPIAENGASAAADAQRSRARSRAGSAVVRERMRIESVWLAYGENWVVRDVTLPVRQGEVLALIGASGSGKTTLLRSLNRLTEVTAGGARAGHDHARRPGDPRARGQRPAPARLDGLPAAEPVPDEHLRQRRLRAGRAAPAARAPARGARRRSSRPSRTRCGAPGCTTRSPTISRARRCGSPAASSSGCASRARWRRSPEVLLLDEPCSALDPISTATIEELIVGLRESVAIVIVTHNLQQAFRVADHVAFMHLGELVEYGIERAGVRPPGAAAHARLHRRRVRMSARRSR